MGYTLVSLFLVALYDLGSILAHEQVSMHVEALKALACLTVSGTRSHRRV
jgi:hypothetical protein